MTNVEQWPDYLRRVTGGATGAEIARVTGISPSTVSRWLSGETRPGPDKLEVLAQHYPVQLAEAIKIANAYRPPMARVIDYMEGERVVIRADVQRGALIKYFSDLELAHEIVRRIEEHDSVETPVALPLADEPSNVTAIGRRGSVRGSSHDLAEVANDSIDEKPVGTDADFDNA